MKIKIFSFSPFQVNTFIVYDSTNECIIIDAACYFPNEEKELSSFIETNKLKPVKILNTHGHIDHIFGNNFLKNKFQCPIYGHADDNEVVANAKAYGAHFGIEISEPPPFTEKLNDNDVLFFGNTSLKVLHTPGHTKGGVCFYFAEDNVLISGDTLFCNSIGRTDLPGGNYEKIIHSIKSKLMILPDNTIVYPGHGPETSIEAEKKENPFL